jgi:hypothetical protein
MYRDREAIHPKVYDKITGCPWVDCSCQYYVR